VLYWWLSVFLEVMQQGLPGFAEVESPMGDKYTDTSQPELFFLHLPRKMEPIEGSETSAFKPQTPGKYPKENLLSKPSLLKETVRIHKLHP